MTRWPVITLLLAAFACPQIARAQSDEQDPVYEQVRRERRHQSRRHDLRALELLRQRYESSHELRALGTMGLVEIDLHDDGPGERHLSEALAATPTPWANENRAVLETALQQCRRRLGVGALLVRSATDGAEVFVNGALVGSAGRPVRVGAGGMTFEVRAPGFRSASRTVNVSAGETVVEEVTLEREETPVQQTPSLPPAPETRVQQVTSGTAVSATVRSAAPSPVVMPPSGMASPSGRSTSRTLAWVSAGGAVAFAGLGVVATLVGQPAADRWNGSACDGASGTTGDCGDDYQTAQTMQALQWVGLVGAGALAATSAVLFVVSSRGTSPARSAFACGAGPGTLGVACGGRF